MIGFDRLATVSASLAAFGMVATPVAAASLPVASATSHERALHYDADAGNAHGWGDRRWRRHSGAHLRTGDAIAGIAIIGAIAAIAHASSENNRTRTQDVYRERPVREPNYRYDDRRQSGWGEGRGITSAVDMCVNQVERGDDRVDSVDQATRDGEGWRVAGTLGDGSGFTCRIDNEGRIRSIDLGDGYAAYQAGPAATAEGQLSDEAYRSARAATRTPIDEKPGADQGADQPQPAYPGGPLPGEELGEGVDADLGG